MYDLKYFIGTWVSSLPFDSDDYLIEYSIFEDGGSLGVRARDYRDNEEMLISDVTFDGEVLQFTSVMPSTGRIGLNRFTLTSEQSMGAEFTFTVNEHLKKLHV